MIYEVILKTSFQPAWTSVESLLNNVCEFRSCAFVLHRSGGFFSKILKKRPHKEAQTPDNGDLTLAQTLNERPTGGEGIL